MLCMLDGANLWQAGGVVQWVLPCLLPTSRQVILWALAKLGHKAGTPQLPNAFVADMVQRVSPSWLSCFLHLASPRLALPGLACFGAACCV